jgi:hypothetical protein
MFRQQMLLKGSLKTRLIQTHVNDGVVSPFTTYTIELLLLINEKSLSLKHRVMAVSN